MHVGSITFAQQLQRTYAWQSNVSASRLVPGATESSRQIDIAMATAAAAADTLARTAIDFHLSAGIIAARAGMDLILKTAQQADGPKAPAEEINDQVSVNGTLAGQVDFGVEGPSVSGGYQFLTGAALDFAFDVAMAGIKSHGESIDTFSVTRNTLTAGTSGSDAHDVYRLTLRPETGLWTFTLVNPIDLPADVFEPSLTLDLSALIQGVKSDGQTVEPSNAVKITIDDKRTHASSTATIGTVHQGGLAYTAPSTAAATAAPMPPINPLTGYRYVMTSAATASLGASINLFA